MEEEGSVGQVVEGSMGQVEVLGEEGNVGRRDSLIRNPAPLRNAAGILLSTLVSLVVVG